MPLVFLSHAKRRQNHPVVMRLLNVIIAAGKGKCDHAEQCRRCLLIALFGALVRIKERSPCPPALRRSKASSTTIVAATTTGTSGRNANTKIGRNLGYLTE